MKWFKLQAVLVAFALLAAACQCVAACAAEQPQAASHCHKNPKPTKTHCVSATVLAEAALSELSLPAPAAFLPAQNALRVLPGCPHTPSPGETFPPYIVFSTILRI